MMSMTLIDTARELARHNDGRFGAQEHTSPEATLVEPDGETPEMAEERGIADARGARPANPGFHLDAYMTGYSTEYLDITHGSWE